MDGEFAPVKDIWIKFHKAIACATTLFRIPMMCTEEKFSDSWVWVAEQVLPPRLLRKMEHVSKAERPQLKITHRMQTFAALVGQNIIGCEEGYCKMKAVLQTKEPELLIGFRFRTEAEKTRFKSDIWDNLQQSFPCVASTTFVHLLFNRPLIPVLPHDVHLRLIQFIQSNQNWREVLIAIARYQYLFALEKGAFQPTLNTFCGFGEFAYFVYWLVGDNTLDQQFTTWLYKTEFNNLKQRK